MQNDLRELRDLRRNLTVALETHSVEGSDIQGAVLAASELVTNAISYSDGDVDVFLDWSGGEVVLTVSDFGPGFSLADVQVPDRHEASGRGLLIVSKVVAELSVTPNEPAGSVVRAVLPVRPACVPAADVIAAEEAGRGAAARRPSDELTRFQLRPGLGGASPLPAGLRPV